MRFLFSALQFDKVLFLYDIPAETTEEVLRAICSPLKHTHTHTHII
jgi:hypothetical protein